MLTDFQRFSTSKSNTEVTEMCAGIARRCEELEIPHPEMVIVDNCCHVRPAILKALPNTRVVLDFFHYRQRYVPTTPISAARTGPDDVLARSYLLTVLNGTRNPYYKTVSQDIAEAIYEARAEGGKPAKYRAQTEQIRRMEDMYLKYNKLGTVWSVASTKVSCACPVIVA